MMARSRDGASVRQVRALFNVGTVAGLTDRQLVERYATRGGEASELAFAALVERHGSMVLRACRDILGDEHGAQDAFQATFLVLARRSGALRARDSLGPWLHEVATRVALGARSAAARRRRHEHRAAELAARSVHAEAPDELGPALHEEVGRLPDPYRAAVVLCCLQGLTHEQAARQLGCPLGTVLSRVARGRERLRGRLVRRGLAPGAILVALAPPGRGTAAVSPALAASTIRGAAAGLSTAMSGAFPATAVALAEGVLRTMMLTKMKVALLGLLSTAILAGGAGILAGQPATRPAPGETNAGPAATRARGDGTATPAREPEEALKRRILKSARQRLEAQRAFYLEGRITIDRYLDASAQARMAEAQASQTYEGRVAAARAHLERVKEVEARESVELKDGRGTVADVTEAVQCREQAELDLIETEKSAGRHELAILRDRVSAVETKLDQVLKALDEIKRRRD